MFEWVPELFCACQWFCRTLWKWERQLCELRLKWRAGIREGFLLSWQLLLTNGPQWCQVVNSGVFFSTQCSCSLMSRQRMWNITVKAPSRLQQDLWTLKILRHDFLGVMGSPFLPPYTFSNLNWNKIRGVKSALFSVNSESHSVNCPGGILVWHLSAILVSLAHVSISVCSHRKWKKIHVSWREAGEKAVFQSVWWDY